ncbi:zincin-like metallopeptidase domain-containing protein, partial [Rhizorhabdus dicambivorans]
VLEAPMDFTFQPPFLAGLSGYVAEMGSAFLCAALGIVPTVRHADYIGAWLEVLREDSRAIFRAASAATKAADWLLSRHQEARSAREDQKPDADAWLRRAA